MITINSNKLDQFKLIELALVKTNVFIFTLMQKETAAAVMVKLFNVVSFLGDSDWVYKDSCFSSNRNTFEFVTGLDCLRNLIKIYKKLSQKNINIKIKTYNCVILQKGLGEPINFFLNSPKDVIKAIDFIG